MQFRPCLSDPSGKGLPLLRRFCYTEAYTDAHLLLLLSEADLLRGELLHLLPQPCDFGIALLDLLLGTRQLLLRARGGLERSLRLGLLVLQVCLYLRQLGIAGRRRGIAGRRRCCRRSKSARTRYRWLVRDWRGGLIGYGEVHLGLLRRVTDTQARQRSEGVVQASRKAPPLPHCNALTASHSRYSVRKAAARARTAAETCLCGMQHLSRLVFHRHSVQIVEAILAMRHLSACRHGHAAHAHRNVCTNTNGRERERGSAGMASQPGKS